MFGLSTGGVIGFAGTDSSCFTVTWGWNIGSTDCSCPKSAKLNDMESSSVTTVSGGVMGGESMEFGGSAFILIPLDVAVASGFPIR